MKKIYLGQGSTSKGPFTEAQFQAMLKSGEADTYAWIWDERFRRWKPLHDAPPPPREAAVSVELKSDGVQVLCFDRLNVLSGELQEINTTGCVFHAESASRTPLFKPDSRLTLNLLDPEAGTAANLLARLEGLGRDPKTGAIRYRLRWEGDPSFAIGA